MANESIAEGKVVNLIYSLKNAKGEVLDRSDTENPFTYLHGAQQIVPGLEAALLGLKVGAKKNVVVEPAEGYGEMNPDLKLTVSKGQFPSKVEIEEGMQFEAHTPDGQGVVFTVEGIEGDQVKIDGNHPLAGQTLHFDVEVLSMRDATDEEKEHGHAHGEGGHDHDHEGHDHGDHEGHGGHEHEHGPGCSHDHGDGEGGHGGHQH
jgi:FKBP-type peptidyl-prolyl cis-trans isomerase SlyD